MQRPSKVDRLPPEIREKISDLRERGFTIDEIMAQLTALPIAPQDLPSRSGLHRHVQGLDSIAEKLQRSRAVAEALVRRLGDAPENRAARLNIELMHSVVTDVMMAASEAQANGQAATFDPEQVMLLAKSLDHLARAAKGDAELTIKLREQVRKELEAEMRQKLESASAGKGGFNPEVAEEARRILGFA
jgi:hypothetical protein